MNLKKYRLALLVSIISIEVLGSVTIFMLQNQSAPEKQLYFQYPTGTASSLSTVTLAQGSEQQTGYNTISVSGSGTASMQADEATVTLGVQTQGTTASEAVDSNAELMAAVTDAIKTLGLTEEDMRTVSYNVYPLYSKEDYETVVGYRVVNMIAVEVTDMDLIGQVIDAAADNGANRIQGVSFGLSSEKQAELQMQAYVVALRDAEGKVLLIASELEVTITGVLSVSENVYSSYQPYYDYRVSYAGEAAPTTMIIEGRLSVSVTVYVVYSFG
jgi:uncharacterized protein YggE